jgi:hypothetical protein
LQLALYAPRPTSANSSREQDLYGSSGHVSTTH